MTRSNQNYRAAIGFATAILVVASGTSAFASDPSDYRYQQPQPFHQPVTPYPVEMGFSQHHSSTLQEGWQRGRAALIQAWGNFRLMESQAQILFEQARALNRDNDLMQTQALYTQQKMWRDERVARREYHDERIAQGKVKLTARRSTVYREAYRLTPNQLDPVTGQINWPVALQAAKFQAECDQMEELFRQHVSYGDPQPALAAEIARCGERLERALRRDLATLPRADYLAAQKFLRGLKLEASAMAETT